MRIRIDRGVLKKILCLAAVLFIMLDIILLLRAWENRQNIEAGGSSSTNGRNEPIDYNGVHYEPRRGIKTTLLMGVDKYFVDELGQGVQGEFEQADFLMLLVTDTRNETNTIIHINRDTMAEITILNNAGGRLGTYTAQITLAHTYGGTDKIRSRNTVEAVSDLLKGVKIQHYVSLGMDGMVALNELAGGVTVEVLDDFTGIDDTLVQGETVTLHGEQALTYIRQRHGMQDATNIHRMERQRQYIEALENQLLEMSANDEEFVASSLLEINDYLVSDCTVEQLSDLAESLEEYGIAEYRTLKGENVQGSQNMEYYIDEDALMETVLNLFYEPS